MAGRNRKIPNTIRVPSGWDPDQARRFIGIDLGSNVKLTTKKSYRKEVMEVFDKYIKKNVRSLKKDQAIEMFEKEFGLDKDQGETMFNTFDKDQNGIMSIWEFQQFYVAMGNQAQAIVEKFKEIDADGSGKLDVAEATEGLKSLQTATGRTLEQKEVEFFIKTTSGDDGQIDLGAFTNLLYRLKLYNAPPPK